MKTFTCESSAIATKILLLFILVAQKCRTHTVRGKPNEIATSAAAAAAAYNLYKTNIKCK